MYKNGLILLLFLFLASCNKIADPEKSSEVKPNIIYILADDLGYRETGAYGQTIIKTPSIDKLANEGMLFTQHYSGSTVCAPSRCVLLTGLHTGHSYIRGNYELGGYRDDNEGGQMPLPPHLPNMAKMLQDAGYVTGVIGKWGLGGPGSTGIPSKQGFDYFYGYLCQKQAHNYYPSHLWENNHWDTLRNEYFSPHQKWDGEDIHNPEEYKKYKGVDYAMDKMGEKALAFIRDHQYERFFLYLPFPVPHVSLQVPDVALLMYDHLDDTPYLGERSYLPHIRPHAAYAAMITRMDQHIGNVMALLKELDIEKSTIVMFSSDNGTTYNGGVDMAFFNSLGELSGYKTWLGEGGIRVPFIVKWPGVVEPGSKTNHISAFWDILPTIRDITDGTYPNPVDGISLVPILTGHGDQQEKHDFLYWEYPARGGMQAVRMGRWKAIRLNTRKEPGGPIALYDLENDISETTDVSASHPDIVAKMEMAMSTRTRAHIKEWNPVW